MRSESTVELGAALGLSLSLIACGRPLISADANATTSEVADTDTGGDTSSTTSATTPGDPTTDTSGSSSTSVPSFLPEFDEPLPPCDPFLQDCPDGEKCVPYGSTGGNWDASKCVPVLGQQLPGEPCTYGGVVEATDDCDATSICWDVMDVDGEPIGTCMLLCLGTPDEPQCPPTQECLHWLINVCVSSCDPLLQDCGSGLACFWANNSFNCIFTTEDIPLGEPCGYINDCAAGLMCLDASLLPSCAGAACCSSFCDINLGDAQCDALPGSSCVPFFEPNAALPGYEHIGVCSVP